MCLCIYVWFGINCLYAVPFLCDCDYFGCRITVNLNLSEGVVGSCDMCAKELNKNKETQG